MNPTQDGILTIAKQEFVSLLDKFPPSECKDFLDWIIEQHAGLKSKANSHLSDAFQQCIYAEQSLESIIQDLRIRLPLSGACHSEITFMPDIGQNSDCNPATTVVIDSFLYNDDDVDKLCEENKLTRNYCQDCGSHNTAPLTFISHSISVLQMKFIFQTILPRLITNFSNTTLVDIGSRLGAVLYGAHYFSLFPKIIGVEMNVEFCHIQNEIVNKYGLGNRIQIICNDVCNIGEVLQEADVIVINNTFEFFLPREVQISTWQNIRTHICKSGCILITVPSVEESVSLGNAQQPILDLESWLVPLTIDPRQSDLDYTEDDLDELSKVNFYKVK